MIKEICPRGWSNVISSLRLWGTLRIESSVYPLSILKNSMLIHNKVKIDTIRWYCAIMHTMLLCKCEIMHNMLLAHEGENDDYDIAASIQEYNEGPRINIFDKPQQ